MVDKAHEPSSLYAEVSQGQKYAILSVGESQWSAIVSIQRRPQLYVGAGIQLLRMADLGCATGSNTITSTLTTLQHVLPWLHANSTLYDDLELQLFFNDLQSNDFNSLFRNQLHQQNLTDAIVRPLSKLWASDVKIGDTNSYDDKRRRLRVFAAGVPGSFYQRLFPACSIHVFTCFNALHWLSKVPGEILDKSSPAYNKGHISSTAANVAVEEAYRRQQRNDLTEFLTARGEELVPGGLLLIASLCKQENNCVNANTIILLILDEFVKEGVITEDMLDTFNVNYDYIREEDMKQAINDCGKFDVHMLEKTPTSSFFPQEMMEGFLRDPHKFSFLLGTAIHNTLGGHVQQHFGLGVSQKLFAKLHEALEAKASVASSFQDLPLIFESNILVLLSRI